MVKMMILSWSRRRLQHVINDENSTFFHQKRDKALTMLRSYGVVHGDDEWRNILWDDLGGRLVVIDLEDVKWLKRPQALEPTSGNKRRGHRAGAEEHRKRLLSRSTAVSI
jgi:Ser/Thr protein kinase RdoA (MazF antagonist)